MLDLLAAKQVPTIRIGSDRPVTTAKAQASERWMSLPGGWFGWII
jgi:hypothetical protein